MEREGKLYTDLTPALEVARLFLIDAQLKEETVQSSKK